MYFTECTDKIVFRNEMLLSYVLLSNKRFQYSAGNNELVSTCILLKISPFTLPNTELFVAEFAFITSKINKFEF